MTVWAVVLPVVVLVARTLSPGLSWLIGIAAPLARRTLVSAVKDSPQPCSSRSSLSAVASSAASSAAVGDALVDGVGLAVDAVGVDLEQDGDGVPGAAGDLGGGHPGV